MEQKWITDDKCEFSSKESAEKHEAVLRHCESYEKARKKLIEAIAEAELTADGKPFDPFRATPYWAVFKTDDGHPYLQDVRVISLFSGFELTLMMGESGYEVYVSKARYEWYPISELYYDRGEAMIHLKKCQKDHLEFLQEQWS